MIGGLHDVQAPAGAQAQAIVGLWHWLLPICAIVFVAVMIALGLALWRAPRGGTDTAPAIALLAVSVMTDRALSRACSRRCCRRACSVRC